MARKTPVTLTDPMLLDTTPQRIANGEVGHTAARYIHVVNTGAIPARIWLGKNGNVAASAILWGCVLLPGKVRALPCYIVLEENATLEAWADVAGAVCVSVYGDCYRE